MIDAGCGLTRVEISFRLENVRGRRTGLDLEAEKATFFVFVVANAISSPFAGINSSPFGPRAEHRAAEFGARNAARFLGSPLIGRF